MARPAMKPEQRRKQIGVRVSPETLEQLDFMAKDRGVSIGRVAEELVVRGIGQTPIFHSLDQLTAEVKILRAVIAGRL